MANKPELFYPGQLLDISRASPLLLTVAELAEQKAREEAEKKRLAKQKREAAEQRRRKEREAAE